MSYVITKSVKSRGIAALLVFFLWPFGLFYSTLAGALIMSFIVGPFILWISLSSGLALILLPLFFIACMIWTIVAVNIHNRKIIEDAAFYNRNVYNAQSATVLPAISNNEEQITERYPQEIIYEDSKSNKYIYILALLLLSTFIYLLYDKNTNSLKLDRITSIFTNSSSKEKDQIKIQLEKTYFDILNGKYTAQNMTGGVEMPFYNTNVSSLFVMGLGPLATFTGNLKIEPHNIEVYRLSEKGNNASIKYDLKVITKEDTTMGSVDMDIKKIGGQWKFDAEKFFSLKTLNKNKSTVRDQASKNKLLSAVDLDINGNNPSNSLIGKNINIPDNRHYSIFYIDTQKEIPFDEFLIIGDTLYCNRDIYEDEPGEAIDKRIIKKLYRIKNFRNGSLSGSTQKLRNNRQFSLYDISSNKELAEVNIDGTSTNERNEKIYEWEINWRDKNSETFKTSLYVPEISSAQQKNDKVF